MFTQLDDYRLNKRQALVARDKETEEGYKIALFYQNNRKK